LNSSGCQGVITAFLVTTALTMVVLPAENLFPHVSHTQIDRDLSSVMTNDTRVRAESQVGSNILISFCVFSMGSAIFMTVRMKRGIDCTLVLLTAH